MCFKQWFIEQKKQLGDLAALSYERNGLFLDPHSKDQTRNSSDSTTRQDGTLSEKELLEKSISVHIETKIRDLSVQLSVMSTLLMGTSESRDSSESLVDFENRLCNELTLNQGKLVALSAATEDFLSELNFAEPMDRTLVEKIQRKTNLLSHGKKPIWELRTPNATNGQSSCSFNSSKKTLLAQAKGSELNYSYHDEITLTENNIRYVEILIVKRAKDLSEFLLKERTNLKIKILSNEDLK